MHKISCYKLFTRKLPSGHLRYLVGNLKGSGHLPSITPLSKEHLFLLLLSSYLSGTWADGFLVPHSKTILELCVDHSESRLHIPVASPLLFSLPAPVLGSTFTTAAGCIDHSSLARLPSTQREPVLPAGLVGKSWDFCSPSSCGCKELISAHPEICSPTAQNPLWKLLWTEDKNLLRNPVKDTLANTHCICLLTWIHLDVTVLSLSMQLIITAHL